MNYRKEIDGLRALAVIPVILFHAGFSGFDGGYVGVDIFFVISGFLITSIIVEEVRQNKFSLVNFYERRARRILPALFAVLIVSTVLAYTLMPPVLLKQYSQSLVSVMGFASNVYFYLTSGYFSSAADEKPLLHTWSLAVEEQYYVFFPLLVMWVWQKGKRFLFVSIFAIAVISLGVAQHLANQNSVNANFYLIFSRAWELMMGSMIALLPSRYLPQKRWVNELGALTGLSMILYSIVFFDNLTPFPSVYALLPVVGTCLMIVCMSQHSIIGRVFSIKPLVLIGLISYSLYLWHQPLFAFLRMKTIGEPTHAAFTVAIILTFVCAALSYQTIEQPFRNKRKMSRKTIFTQSAVAISVTIAIGLAGHINKGFPERFDTTDYAKTISYSPKREVCHTRGEQYLPPIEACRYFNENVSWAVFGDSHLVEVAYQLGKKLETQDEGVLHLTFSGCPPLLVDRAAHPGCSDWLNEALNVLVSSAEIKNVIVGFRHSKHLFGSQLESYPDVPSEDPSITFANNSTMSREDAAEQYWFNFKRIVDLLVSAGKVVYVMYPIPELPVDINKALSPKSIFSEGVMLDPHKTTETAFYNERNSFIIEKLNSLPYSHSLKALNPAEVICDNGFCSAVKEGKALYFDDNHLSLAGATQVLNTLSL